MKLVFPVGPVLYLDHRLELLVVVVGSIYERGWVWGWRRGQASHVSKTDNRIFFEGRQKDLMGQGDTQSTEVREHKENRA